MDPAVIDAFVRPSLASTAVFLAICGAVVAAFLAGVRAAAPEYARAAAIGAVAWLAVTAGAVVVNRSAELAVVGFLLVCNVAAVALALSPLGRRLATLSAGALIGFQAFRLPLEVVLHDWYLGGTMPIQMTWEGQNLDILTGITAAALGLLALRIELPKRAVWGFQVLGLGLLLNVMRVAATSAPTPLRAFDNDPPVLLPFVLPFPWIVSICVAGALAGHLILLRKQLAR